MTHMQWITYAVPAMAGVLAVAGLLYARHIAAEFDRRFDRHPPAGE